MTYCGRMRAAKRKKPFDNYWDHSYPVKIVSICKAMGVTPYTGELPEGVSGMIVKEHSSEPEPTRNAPNHRQDAGSRSHTNWAFVERVTIAQDNDFGFMDKRSDDLRHPRILRGRVRRCAAHARTRFHPEVKNDGMIAAAAYFGVSLAAVRKRMERLRKHGADI